MNEFQFAMVSEWMENSNINEFLTKNPGADRLGLVRSPFGFLSFLLFMIVDDWMTSPVGRCGKWVDIHARRGYNPWRSQRGTFLIVRITLSSDRTYTLR